MGDLSVDSPSFQIALENPIVNLSSFGESDMKVAILGSGIVGQTLGAGFLKHG
jgi:hypothetical protein